MHETAEKLALRLSEHDINAGVINARFVKPIDRNQILKSASQTKLIITLEDGVLNGGFGSALLEVLDEENIFCPVERIGWPDQFIDHGTSVKQLRETVGLDLETILNRILKPLNESDNSAPEVQIR